MKKFLLCLSFVVVAAMAGANPTENAAMTEPEQLAEEEQDARAEEIRRGVRMGGEDGRSREQISYERVIATVEPGIKGSPERLDVYTNLFMREMIHDRRLFATEVSARWDDARDAVVLEGHVMFAENKRALERLFHYLQFGTIDNQVLVLPDEALGERLYGLVTVPRAFLTSAPEPPRETLNEMILGEPVFLLKEAENGHFLAAMADGYIGYVDGAAIGRVNAADFAAYQAGSVAILTRDFTPADGPEGFYLPVGSRLKAVSSLPGNGSMIVRLPAGAPLEMVPLPAGAYIQRDGAADARAMSAVETAESILGTDYRWGGRTSEGVDCSGLVQISYQNQGIYLGRDASMQMYAGRLVATRWYREGLRHGDLLYFLGGNGKVTHTAIYMGDGKYIEASGSVKYTSVNPSHENYSERRDRGFAFAKRLFD